MVAHRTLWRERVEGGIWGLLVGDALGVPYEFTPPARVPLPAQIEFDPPKSFVRAHDGIRPGTWSDDGAQALCLADSLLERGRLDPADLMGRFSRWFKEGYFAVGKDMFDVGLQTRQAIGRFLSGKPPVEPGQAGEWTNGNGSLMRALPLALWHKGSDEELVRDAFAQSATTHGHVRSAVCCGLYVLWARATLDGDLHPWYAAIERFEAMFPPGTPERDEYEQKVHPREPDACKGSGYVVDCLLSAELACRAGDFEAVVKAAVAMGNDTDTTACVAGGIAGIRDGVGAVPLRWMSRLRGKEMVLPVIDGLVARGPRTR